MMTASLLSVRDLRVDINRGRRRAPVVDGVSFDINEGETFAIVGESGCGKSTVAAAIDGLLPARARVAGSIRFDGRELDALFGDEDTLDEPAARTTIKKVECPQCHHEFSP